LWAGGGYGGTGVPRNARANVSLKLEKNPVTSVRRHQSDVAAQWDLRKGKTSEGVLSTVGPKEGADKTYLLLPGEISLKKGLFFENIWRFCGGEDESSEMKIFPLVTGRTGAQGTEKASSNGQNPRKKLYRWRGGKLTNRLHLWCGGGTPEPDN